MAGIAKIMLVGLDIRLGGGCGADPGRPFFIANGVLPDHPDGRFIRQMVDSSGVQATPLRMLHSAEPASKLC
jgi:hypothetical protein